MKKGFGAEQYFEDFTVGDEFEAGPVAFTEEEIIAFARQFDPQGFHTDPEFAREHFFSGLIASGWHVLAKTFRALVDAGFLRGGGMGSPGIDELRWKKPVRPGDELRVILRVTKTRASETRWIGRSLHHPTRPHALPRPASARLADLPVRDKERRLFP